MFQAGFIQADVAGGADAGDVGGLPHGALHAGADAVPLFPVLAGLPGLGGRDGLVDLARAQEQLAAGARCGALGPGRAGLAASGGEPDHDRLPFPCWTQGHHTYPYPYPYPQIRVHQMSRLSALVRCRPVSL